jgi:hypothetical protein
MKKRESRSLRKSSGFPFNPDYALNNLFRVQIAAISSTFDNFDAQTMFARQNYRGALDIIVP